MEEKQKLRDLFILGMQITVVNEWKVRMDGWTGEFRKTNEYEEWEALNEPVIMELQKMINSASIIKHLPFKTFLQQPRN